MKDPFAFMMAASLILMNGTTYLTTKYLELRGQPKAAAIEVIKEYDNYFFAKPFAYGRYKAAVEHLQEKDK